MNALLQRIEALEKEIAELKGIPPDRKYQIREIARRFNAGDKTALREWNKKQASPGAQGPLPKQKPCRFRTL